jgi:hypothetical protein
MMSVRPTFAERTLTWANAAKAVEMAQGAWQAGLAGARVAFPLKERGPLPEKKA